MRGERRKEFPSVLDAHQLSRACGRGGEPRRERTGCEAETRLTADRFEQPPPHLADRLTPTDNTIEVEPRDALVAHLDDGGEVVEGRGEKLADANNCLF